MNRKMAQKNKHKNNWEILKAAEGVLKKHETALKEFEKNLFKHMEFEKAGLMVQAEMDLDGYEQSALATIKRKLDIRFMQQASKLSDEIGKDEMEKLQLAEKILAEKPKNHAATPKNTSKFIEKLKDQIDLIERIKYLKKMDERLLD